MAMENSMLQGYIKNVSERIPDEDLPLLASCAKHVHFKKGEPLIKEGDLCRAFYLVETGYLRTWFNKDGVEINLDFTFEGQFTTSRKSIKNHTPSEVTIEAGEKTSVWIFDLDSINNEFGPLPQIAMFIRRLVVHILMISEEHSDLFKLYTPTERYQYIEKNNPALLQRISLSQIASYLGVTRETLSRIRAKNH